MALTRTEHETSAAVNAASAHIRRCEFRRLTVVRGGRRPVYEAECLYPDWVAPLPLGDYASAGAICAACEAAGIFRPDED